MNIVWERKQSPYTQILWVDGRMIGLLSPDGNPDVARVPWVFVFPDGDTKATTGVYNYKETEQAKRDVANIIRFRAEKTAENIKKNLT